MSSCGGFSDLPETEVGKRQKQEVLFRGSSCPGEQLPEVLPGADPR